MMRALTLVETIVIIGITTMVVMALTSLIVFFYRTNDYTLEESAAVWQARNGVESAMTYLREASYASDGSYPIARVATSSITFYANIDTDSRIEQLTYSLINKTLYLAVGEPSGNPLSYVGMSISTSTIATSVINGTSTPAFRYFDNTGTELTAPVNVGKIASIRSTLVVDVNINRAPVSFTLTSGATLRNLGNQ